MSIPRAARRREDRVRVRRYAMAVRAPVGELDPRYSSDSATPTPWEEARRQVETAKAYWLATVRPDGRPHVTTIAAVWLDGGLHFATGESERKAKNLARNSQCVITTGCHVLEGLDVVLEGEAARVTDTTTLQRLANAYIGKYEQLFRFKVRDGVMHHEGAVDRVLTYRLRATKALGFAKGERFSQTRWHL
jgi:Pyridoxamine 5'-phosphate oxidase